MDRHIMPRAQGEVLVGRAEPRWLPGLSMLAAKLRGDQYHGLEAPHVIAVSGLTYLASALAVHVCVSGAVTDQLPQSFVGREFDAALLDELPPETDPCGERGEFHTCVYAGPMFAFPVPLQAGEGVNRDGFAYADFTASTLAG